MHYFNGISVDSLAKELVYDNRSLTSSGVTKRDELQKNAPVLVEIDGQRCQVFGVRWDRESEAMVLTAMRPSRSVVESEPGAAIKVERYELTESEQADLSIPFHLPSL